MIKFRINKLFQFLCFLFATFTIMTNAKLSINNLNQKSTFRGMVIDAGSGGSTLHIYSWKLQTITNSPSVSVPEANEIWTGRVDPGISTFFENPEHIITHLGPLLEFAKSSLVGLEDSFHYYPIYFKATAGMRELESNQREFILQYVRIILSDKKVCPFYFENDFARVITSEEEAIFSWAATNFLMDTLLSPSLGSVLGSVANRTHGTLDLSDSSAQIAFHVPSKEDTTDGLYSLQIGTQRHWNVYTKSFLQFGVVSARLRHLTDLADQFVAAHPTETRAPGGGGVFSSFSSSSLNYCFHAGYSENAVDSTGMHTVDVSGPLMPLQDQLGRCEQAVRGLMERKFGRFCSEVDHGDCSIGGVFQPPLPVEQFILQSAYRHPWRFLLMPPTGTLQLFRSRAEQICAMNFGDVLFYFESNNLGLDPLQLSLNLPYYCFMTSYVLVLLQDGFRFEANQPLAVLSDVPGRSAGWSLGAMLYEINDEMHTIVRQSGTEEEEDVGEHTRGLVLLGAVLGFVLGAVAAVCIYKEVVEDKERSGGGGGMAGSVGGDYDYDSLSRVPTMELLEAHAVGGAGAVFKHKVGFCAGGGTSQQVASPSSSGSPSTTTLRKSALLPSPYASPAKNPSHRRPSASSSSSSFGAGSGIADDEFGAAGGNGLFKNIPDFRPFQRSGPSSGGSKFDLLPTTITTT